MVGVLGHVDIVPLGEGWDYDPLGCEVHVERCTDAVYLDK